MNHSHYFPKKNVEKPHCYSCSACAVAFLFSNCATEKAPEVLRPVVVTEVVPHDTDDPAIWIHPSAPESSLVIGTDKEKGGGLYLYDLNGKILQDRSVVGLDRPNNVDLGYGLVFGGDTVDFVITTERLKNQLRAYTVPEMLPIDGGGMPVFENVAARAPMGIALYKRPDGQWFVFPQPQRRAGGCLSLAVSHFDIRLHDKTGKGQRIWQVVRK